MLDETNCLRQPYQKYIASQVYRVIRQIPKERRLELAEDIKVRVNIMGYQNGDALKAALKHLKEEK